MILNNFILETLPLFESISNSLTIFYFKFLLYFSIVRGSGESKYPASSFELKCKGNILLLRAETPKKMECRAAFTNFSFVLTMKLNLDAIHYFTWILFWLFSCVIVVYLQVMLALEMLLCLNRMFMKCKLLQMTILCVFDSASSFTEMPKVHIWSYWYKRINFQSTTISLFLFYVKQFQRIQIFPR